MTTHATDIRGSENKAKQIKKQNKKANKQTNKTEKDKTRQKPKARIEINSS
mgnify:FL=1